MSANVQMQENKIILKAIQDHWQQHVQGGAGGYSQGGGGAQVTRQCLKPKMKSHLESKNYIFATRIMWEDNVWNLKWNQILNLNFTFYTLSLATRIRPGVNLEVLDSTRVPDSTREQVKDSVGVQTQALVRVQVQTTTKAQVGRTTTTMATQLLPRPVLMQSWAQVRLFHVLMLVINKFHHSFTQKLLSKNCKDDICVLHQDATTAADFPFCRCWLWKLWLSSLHWLWQWRMWWRWIRYSANLFNININPRNRQ